MALALLVAAARHLTPGRASLGPRPTPARSRPAARAQSPARPRDLQFGPDLPAGVARRGRGRVLRRGLLADQLPPQPEHGLQSQLATNLHAARCPRRPPAGTV